MKTLTAMETKTFIKTVSFANDHIGLNEDPQKYMMKTQALIGFSNDEMSMKWLDWGNEYYSYPVYIENHVPEIGKYYIEDDEEYVEISDYRYRLTDNVKSLFRNKEVI